MATYRELPSGRIQARVFHDGTYKSIGTFETKKEAEIKAGEAERRIYYGEGFIDRDMPLQVVIDEWFDEKAGTIKDRTKTSLEAIKRLHIEPFFGKKKLFKLRRKDVVDWVTHYRNLKNKDGTPKFAYNTRLNILATLKDIFNYAIYDMEILSKSPAGRVSVPRNDVDTKKVIKYYNLNDLETLLDFLKDYEPDRYKEYRLHYTLLYFLSRTGLRIGEALGLTWGDFDGERIDVNKQASRDDKNNLSIISPKTLSSYRSIRIDEETSQLLRDFRRIQNKMILKHDNFHRNKHMAIFQNHDGTHLIPSTIRNSLRRYCNMCGIEYKALHAFRHSHAIISLEAGASLLYISRRLGHGTIKTTADTYLDITNQFEEDELHKISNVFNRNMA